MRHVTVVVLVLLCVAVASLAQAADKPDPNGTWKWSVKFGEQTREMTLKLKLEGDKLTGAMVNQRGETPITDATWKDGDLSFKVTRTRGDQKMTTKYSGKVSGDTITGKSETERDGQAQSREWEAKRAK